MPDFEFSCPNCNQVLEAPDDMAGEVVECPGCQQQMTVPQPPALESPETGAKKPAAVMAAASRCPSCEEEMDDDAVLCVHCGYHIRLGRKITTELR
jgi:DNA-directed RNA polymerase subunit M/transcription elongation factor TFIIS